MNRFRSANAPLDAAPASSGLANHVWRVCAAGVCFTTFGIGTILLTAGLLLVVRPMPWVSAQRKRRWVHAGIGGLSRFFLDLMQALGLMRYSVENATRLKVPGQLIVSNHPSLIDALFIIGCSPGVCCIVKPALLSNPFTAWLVRSAGYLTTDSSELLDEAARVLHEGRSLLVFPEGTRNRCDLSLLFKRGAAHMAIAAEVPVVPVTIDFSPRGLQKGGRWYALPPRPSDIRLMVHPPLDIVGMARRELPAGAPVTLLARRVNERLRDWYLAEARRFADPQGCDQGREHGRPGDADPSVRSARVSSVAPTVPAAGALPSVRS